MLWLAISDSLMKLDTVAGAADAAAAAGDQRRLALKTQIHSSPFRLIAIAAGAPFVS
jgi:hypothetical protein